MFVKHALCSSIFGLQDGIHFFTLLQKARSWEVPQSRLSVIRTVRSRIIGRRSSCIDADGEDLVSADDRALHYLHFDVSYVLAQCLRRMLDRPTSIF